MTFRFVSGFAPFDPLARTAALQHPKWLLSWSREIAVLHHSAEV